MAEQNEKKALEKTQKSKPAKKKDGFLKKASRFFRDLNSEMKKVVWPSKKQVLNNTGVAFVMMGSVGIVIWVLDWVLTVVRGFVLGM
ncbi:MAG: preprotein translocase subunit SecE [Candidatus Merdivicinus sp.]|jgi:preprotein translocase subunit SecE